MLHRRRALVVIVLFAVFLAAVAWVVLAGPAVLVTVTTTDASGSIVPAIGDEVRLWTQNGLVTSQTNADGKVAFQFIRWRAGFVPSLGPESMPQRPLFYAEVRPSPNPQLICPAYSERNIRRFAKWFWQRVEVSRPPYGTIHVNLDDVAVDPRRDYIRITSAGSYQTVVASYVESICVRRDQPLKVSLVVNLKTVHTWPEFVPDANVPTILTVSQAEIENDS